MDIVSLSYPALLDKFKSFSWVTNAQIFFYSNMVEVTLISKNREVLSLALKKDTNLSTISWNNEQKAFLIENDLTTGNLSELRDLLFEVKESLQQQGKYIFRFNYHSELGLFKHKL